MRQKTSVALTILFFSMVVLLPVRVMGAEYVPGAIVLPKEFRGDAGLQFAAGELAEAMETVYGKKPEVASAAGKKGGSSVLVLIGADAGENSVPGLKLPREKLTSEDSYAIFMVGVKDRTAAVVYSPSPRGAAFGLSYFAERIRIDAGAVNTIDVVRNPAFEMRVVSGDTPEGAVRYGYNTVFGAGNHNRMLLLEDYDADFFLGKKDKRDEVLQRREKLNADLEYQDSLHLDSISRADEFEFHKALLDRPVKKKLTRGQNSKWLCVCYDEIWNIYREKYRELMRDFPGIEYTMVRLGENYAKGDYFGNVVALKDVWEYCPKCLSLSYNKRIAKLINHTWDVVVGEFGKKYIHRTWDTNNDTFHTSPDMYLDILSRINNKKNLIISVKYTKTDFWRYNLSNETIGIGDVPQIVEFQCQREYEGKGAFPNYIGENISEGYKLARDKGTIGIWNWHHGGGWNGPNLKSDIWNEANIYAASHLAWDPDAGPEALAREWAAMNFGPENAAGITDILMMSDDAVLKLVYFKAYAEIRGDPWMPNQNWVRDDVIKGTDRLSRIYQIASRHIEEMIEEKEEGVRIVEKMAETAAQLNLKGEKKQIVEDSIKYELYWARVLRDYAAAYFYHRRWSEKAAAEDIKLAKKFADKWRADWKAFKTEIPALKWAASLYNDDGMVKAMEKIINEIDIEVGK